MDDKTIVDRVIEDAEHTIQADAEELERLKTKFLTAPMIRSTWRHSCRTRHLVGSHVVAIQK
jgi:hypothetical protein